LKRFFGMDLEFGRGMEDLLGVVFGVGFLSLFSRVDMGLSGEYFSSSIFEV
jgi:hypothetical protein